jgi:hypothetical protein
MKDKSGKSLDKGGKESTETSTSPFAFTFMNGTIAPSVLHLAGKR